MCGLFGILFAPGTPYASRESIIQTAADAMSYRGRQSWGMAFTESGQSPRMVRGIGEMADTEVGAIARRSSHVIGHTRLATNGAIKLANCHPFKLRSSLVKAPMFVAHNGMVYNWEQFAEPGDEVDSIVLARHVASGESPSELDGYGTVVALSKAGIHWARLDGGDLDRVNVYDDDGRQVCCLLISSVGGARRAYDVLEDLRELGFDASFTSPGYNTLRLLAMRPKHDTVAASGFALKPSQAVRDYSRTRGADAGSGGSGWGNGASWLSRGWMPTEYQADDLLERIRPGSLSVSSTGKVSLELRQYDGRYDASKPPSGMWSTRTGTPTELVSRYGSGEVDLSDEGDLLGVLAAASEPGASDGGPGWTTLIEAWSIISGEPVDMPEDEPQLADVVTLHPTGTDAATGGE